MKSLSKQPAFHVPRFTMHFSRITHTSRINLALRLVAGLVLISALPAGSLHAQIFTFSNLDKPIPDGNPAGVSDVETISSASTQIGSLTVGLTITGNFNGDLYAYVRHNAGFSVLLNRPGRTATNPDGYADSGFQITLSDTAVNGDIHNYQGVFTPPPNSPLTGAWQPDGRTNSPLAVLDTDPRTAFLSSFNGLDANGTWTLFLADLSPGGTSTLNQWQLQISAVPEPGTGALGMLGIAIGIGLKFHRRKRR